LKRFDIDLMQVERIEGERSRHAARIALSARARVTDALHRRISSEHTRTWGFIISADLLALCLGLSLERPAAPPEATALTDGKAT
jgi:hypothetical protein